MSLTWTRKHSLRVDLHPGVDAMSLAHELLGIEGVTGQASTASALTMGFAHRYNQGQLRRGPYRQVRKVLVKYGVITPNARARQA